MVISKVVRAHVSAAGTEDPPQDKFRRPAHCLLLIDRWGDRRLHPTRDLARHRAAYGNNRQGLQHSGQPRGLPQKPCSRARAQDDLGHVPNEPSFSAPCPATIPHTLRRIRHFRLLIYFGQLANRTSRKVPRVERSTRYSSAQIAVQR
jgi:hypothetical protein